MRRFSSAAWLVLLAASSVVACSSDSDGVSAGAGGLNAGGTAGAGGSAQGGSAQGGSTQGGSAQGGSAQGGSAQGGSAQGGSAGSDPGGSSAGGSGGSETGGTAGDAGSSSGGTGDGGTGGNPDTVPNGPSIVWVQGRQLLVKHRQPNGDLAAEAAWDMKGISYNPVPKGENHDGQGRYFAQLADRDIPLMKAAGINTIKTYDPPERNANGLAVLDKYYKAGIKVALTVLPGYDSDYVSAVNYFKDHPAVLMWIVGNEWNYNALYSSHTQGEVMARLQQASQTIHSLDPNHPVATDHGEVPSAQTLATVSDPDLWALNLYPYLSFGDRFSRWANLTNKPMFVGEYGADAWNRNTNSEDQAAQAYAVELLTDEIRGQLSAYDGNKVVIGGCPYAFSDEWWKSGNPGGHDTGGFDNGGVYPDGHATEEWWGIVDIDGNPRQAYDSLKNRYTQ
ncbi:MAG: glycoside hydrolase family 2 TIM barrel-domain containing protein [Polyangiaceae bacterium]